MSWYLSWKKMAFWCFAWKKKTAFVLNMFVYVSIHISDMHWIKGMRISLYLLCRRYHVNIHTLNVIWIMSKWVFWWIQFINMSIICLCVLVWFSELGSKFLEDNIHIYYDFIPRKILTVEWVYYFTRKSSVLFSSMKFHKLQIFH